jgi:hypothetical protein
MVAQEGGGSGGSELMALEAAVRRSSADSILATTPENRVAFIMPIN